MGVVRQLCWPLVGHNRTAKKRWVPKGSVTDNMLCYQSPAMQYIYTVWAVYCAVSGAYCGKRSLHQEKRFLVIAASQDLSYLIVYVTHVSISVVYVVTCSCSSIGLYLCNTIYSRS
jgi:hypothetical protein